MYKERYEMLKEAEKTGANISPIDYSFIDWYEKEAVKYTPQNTSSNSGFEKCKNHDHDLKGSWEYRQCNRCGEYVAVG
jgi:hypothetical protein